MAIAPLKKRTITGLAYLLLFIFCELVPVACNSRQQTSTPAQTITVGVSPWLK